MMKNYLTKSNCINLTTGIVLLTLLVACSSEKKESDDDFFRDYSIDYKKSEQTESLELPPGLSSSRIKDAMVVPEGSTVSFSELNPEAPADTEAATGVEDAETTITAETAAPTVTATDSKVSSEEANIRVERDGNVRWLVVKDTPNNVWLKVRDFWQHLGFLLEKENAKAGIMATEWKENRADIPEDFIRDVLGAVLGGLYSAPTRDSFRTRLEEGEMPQHTEVFISHYGIQEKVSDDIVYWENRAAEPQLEAEMLRRLMVFMGTTDAAARARLAETDYGLKRARLIQDREGNPVLDYDASYPRAWRIVGQVLDRVSFTVEDRDRAEGIYYVRYSDPLKDTGGSGILSSVIFWGDKGKPSEEQYQVALSGDEASTQIIVLDSEGKRDKTETSQRILALLYEHLK